MERRLHGAVFHLPRLSPSLSDSDHDTELRQTVERHKKIAAKIRMGQSKHFRPGTLKKYQAEMEKLEAEQKKRRDELLDKGDEILARLGEE